ncbi:hypothetical protein [Embleya sp. NBC_00896]|uniref:hypothetical protein n=1 Tax=Embleya sp. NBC_00896 TaxID=2975961 RepID=UPI002F917CDF|nr:hypothetical protein OG928_48555 [Embleya sp. NBC_00896]
MTEKLSIPPADNDDNWIPRGPGAWLVVPVGALRPVVCTVTEPAPTGSDRWRVLHGAHATIEDSAEYYEATDRADVRALIARWVEESRATTVYHWDAQDGIRRLECATTVDDWDRCFPRFYVRHQTTGFGRSIVLTTRPVAERAIAEQQAAIILGQSHRHDRMWVEVKDMGRAPSPNLAEGTRFYSVAGRAGVITIRHRDSAVVSWLDGPQRGDSYPSGYPLDLMRTTQPAPFHPHFGQSRLR